jgi:hypothetical protein
MEISSPEKNEPQVKHGFLNMLVFILGMGAF